MHVRTAGKQVVSPQAHCAQVVSPQLKVVSPQLRIVSPQLRVISSQPKVV